MAQAQWSGLLPELLDSIAQKWITCYEDLMAFAGVCRSWKSSAVRGDNLPSRFPCLMLAEEKTGEDREFFLLSSDNKYSIRKLKLAEARGAACLSSRGWLMIMKEEKATAKLVNPLNPRLQINLPNVDTFPDYEDLRWDLSIRRMLLLEEEEEEEEHLVMVLWGCSSKLGFCRPGDGKWTRIRKGWRGMIYDLTYHNGRVYTLDCNGVISECDVRGKHPTTMVDVAKIPKDVYRKVIDGAYILGLDDEDRLLVVIREGVYDGYKDGEELDYSKCMTKSFHLLEYNLRSQKWSKVNDLGTKTLFLGYNSSFWVDAARGTPINANCIYFTDDVYLSYCSSLEGGERDTGIYHLSDGRIAPPIWVESIVHTT